MKGEVPFLGNTLVGLYQRKRDARQKTLGGGGGIGRAYGRRCVIGETVDAFGSSQPR